MKKLAFAALVMFGAASTVHAAGNAAAGQGKTAACAGCHGATGSATTAPTYPKLAGQHASYIAQQLADFKSGTRQDPIMMGMAGALSEEDMADIGAYFATQEKSVGSADAEAVAAGKKIYEAGDKAKGVSACMACHGPSGAGNPGAKFPALSGQNAAYTEKTLKDFRNGARANDPNSMMRDIAARMSDKDIAAVAAYINALK
ncbi:MAG: cytochrome c4 [Chromatiales bacterium]|nr:cytochrome c4 [Chromatiales bacterium]